MGHYRGGIPKKIKLDRARSFLNTGDSLAALRILAGGGSCYVYIDILMDADLLFLEKEKLINECLNSSNPHIRREILLYTEVNLHAKPIQQQQ